MLYAPWGYSQKGCKMEEVQEMPEAKKLEEHMFVRQSRPLEKTHKAAIKSGLSASFLYHNWRQIPAARRAGNALRWDVDELLEWMKQQAHAS